jgi:glutamate carboxypeptidase
MLLVIRALQAAGAFEQFDLRVVLTGDEESPGSPLALARRDLVEAARGCDVAIGFECGSGDPGQAVTARRGSAGWRLRTSGQRAHSSQIFRPGVGAGAVFELARILDAFRDSLAGEPHLTFNAGLALGGSHVGLEGGGAGTASGKPNVVPESALANGDLRALTQAQVVHARAVMTRIAGRHLPRTGPNSSSRTATRRSRRPRRTTRCSRSTIVPAATWDWDP